MSESELSESVVMRSEMQCVKRALWEQKMRRAALTARLQDKDRWIEGIRSSVAWKLIQPLWKLQQHFAKKRSHRLVNVRPVELVFGIDPVRIQTGPSSTTKITGWCFSHGGPEVVGVRAKVKSRSYFARYGLKRDPSGPEILEYPAALDRGFSVTIPTQEVNLSLEAITQGGPWRYFYSNSTSGSAPAQSHPAENSEQVVAVYPALDTGSPDESKVTDILRLAGTQRRSSLQAPVASLLIPLLNVPSRWITEMAFSFRRQTLDDWEGCLLTTNSMDAPTQRLLDQIKEVDRRFKIIPLEGSSSCELLNLALEQIAGEILCFVQPGDLLHPKALATMTEKARQGYDIVYSDEDKFDDKTGERKEPFFKPDWSPEYFRGTMYVRRGMAVRRELARRVRFSPTYDGIHQFEFLLRAAEGGARIGHVANVLYHSRTIRDTITAGCAKLLEIRTLQEKAVNEQLGRLNLPARTERDCPPGRLKFVPLPRLVYPRISIIIPTKDSPELLSRCLESLHRYTAYSNFETILVDNETTDSEAIALMSRYPVTRVEFASPFNFSRANNLGAKHATGDYLLFLNNDTEIVATKWLDHLLYYVEQPEVGAAGALLLHDNGTVQHAGVILGMKSTGDHAMRGFSAGSDGYMGSLSCAREVSAVTAACMMMRKSLFEELGGFDERFSTIYQDLDLCLRLRERGLRIIWTPQALLLHHESMSRPKSCDPGDRTLLLERWAKAIKQGDPYYNQNLDLERGDYGRR